MFLHIKTILVSYTDTINLLKVCLFGSLRRWFCFGDRMAMVRSAISHAPFVLIICFVGDLLSLKAYQGILKWQPMEHIWFLQESQVWSLLPGAVEVTDTLCV